MLTEELVDLSRLQFAVTALYHFLFVPLTLGLAFILVIMELTYVITDRPIYKDMVRFWGKLFGINFALGVTTGITMEFQFGTNWAYYSHYVGDIFGAPLAIEGLMAFFLESTFIGLFFFGWDRLNKWKHFMVTVLMAVGSNLSALWILIANGWMQDPVGATFSFVTMRMEMSDFWAIVFNPTAQAKFVHTVSAGYVTASLFVLGISSYYLLKGRDLDFARRSFRIAAGFGFASALSVIVLGDESGYTVSESQKTKMAAIEAMWETEPAPAAFTVFAVPNEKAERNDYQLQIPYALGLIGTRSLTKTMPGIKEIKAKNRERIENGIHAVTALEQLRKNHDDKVALAQFDAHKADLGFGLLLKKYIVDVSQATPEMIQQAVDDTIPRVAPLFWSFRIMVALGFLFLALFTLALFYSIKGSFIEKKWLLRWALWFIPMPWVAAELGWVVAEYGRQPWTIYGVLPTHISVSNISVGNIYGSLAGFIGFYTVLLIVEMVLMTKYARQGPASLGTGKYHNEHAAGGALPAHAPANRI
ncbi:MAG: cytochrome ubiquinol oxidase subunit I [Pseudomonadota bacterium]